MERQEGKVLEWNGSDGAGVEWQEGRGKQRKVEQRIGVAG
jgi:hypothetical protein